jgi:outer membrane protein OmpA-like peptidoglycan-associated protein
VRRPGVAAFAVLTFAALCGSAKAAEFAGGTDSGWNFRKADGACTLEQYVRDFGMARFTGVPGSPLRFELLTHRDLFAAGSVAVHRVAPPWHRKYPDRQKLAPLPHVSGTGLLVADPLATRLLMALYSGYEAHLQHDSWYSAPVADESAEPAGGSVAVRIGSVKFRAGYEAFAECFRGAAAYGWTALERTRIEYPTAEAALTPADEERLRSVAGYVSGDPKVVRIYIDGHTDDIGGERDNLGLSRQRAEQVRDFLASCGVPESRLVVRYHGARYPVAGNESEDQRARNRRTTVRLEREWSSEEGELATR